MNTDDIYTSLKDIQGEIERRQNDTALQERLDVFWGDRKPAFVTGGEPKLVLSKSLITPNLEFRYFLDIAEDIGLERSLWEYTVGKFVGKNQEKRHLGKLHFFHGRGKKNGKKIDHLNVVNFNTEEGKQMRDVMTLNGQTLVDFHHDLLSKRSPAENLKPIDVSEWFDETKKLDLYYVYYLSLFIRDHILFENFLPDDEEESKFTVEKFFPSFEKVTEIFGIKPLIVPLLPIEHEKSSTWFSYDEETQENVKNMLL